MGLNSKHKYVMSLEEMMGNEDLFSVIMNLVSVHSIWIVYSWIFNSFCTWLNGSQTER